MKLLKNDYLFILFLVLIVFLFLITNRNKQVQNTTVKTNYFQTVARIDKAYRRHFSYTYFYKNKMYQGSKEHRNLILDKYIGNYYLVDLNINNSKESSIDLEQEITDSVQIAAAGFRKKKLSEILE